MPGVDRFERVGEARVDAGTFWADDEGAVDDFEIERRVRGDGQRVERRAVENEGEAVVFAERDKRRLGRRKTPFRFIRAKRDRSPAPRGFVGAEVA